jgi:hypothetical protein
MRLSEKLQQLEADAFLRVGRNVRYVDRLPPLPSGGDRTKDSVLADWLEQAARAMGDRPMAAVTTQLAWAIRRVNRRHVQLILDRNVDDIIGGQKTVDMIMQWLAGKIPESQETERTMKLSETIQALEKAKM